LKWRDWVWGRQESGAEKLEAKEPEAKKSEAKGPRRGTVDLIVMLISDFQARREAFRRLHESGCFVIPNPWDRGTARYLQHLGFPALATTSAGLAFSLGLPDADWAVSRDVALRNIREIVEAVELPVNADFESGYADEPERVAESVRLCVETGVAGLSIEDATGDSNRPLYELPLAVERIRAARAAIDASGSGVLLTGRAECYLVGHPEPLEESIRRLTAYAEAGADVLYAPGPRSREDITAIVSALQPKPVNVLMSANVGLRVSDLAEMGVRRVSVGSSLARAAWTGFLAAARGIAYEGSFAGFDGTTPYAELNAFFKGIGG
jgi:2-methylisocitrate lyase-like PEP mutase family enzyme